MPLLSEAPSVFVHPMGHLAEEGNALRRRWSFLMDLSINGGLAFEFPLQITIPLIWKDGFWQPILLGVRSGRVRMRMERTRVPRSERSADKHAPLDQASLLRARRTKRPGHAYRSLFLSFP